MILFGSVMLQYFSLLYSFGLFLGPLHNHIDSLLISHLQLIALALISTVVAHLNSFHH